MFCFQWYVKSGEMFYCTSTVRNLRIIETITFYSIFTQKVKKSAFKTFISIVLKKVTYYAQSLARCGKLTYYPEGLQASQPLFQNLCEHRTATTVPQNFKSQDLKKALNSGWWSDYTGEITMTSLCSESV